MTGLETAFYIYSIVFMSIILIVLIALVAAVFMIRSKIISIERQIQEKIDQATGIAAKGGELMARAGTKAAASTVKTLRKAVKKVK